ncbi:MAG: hypothetical protein JNL57_13990 [Bacteroidetes bacterium]|nr:hypothetical protein [Bacteroidota bacterium]
MKDPLEKELVALEKQLAALSDEMLALSRDIVSGNYSKHPIFVAHEGQVELGELILDRTEYQVPYSVNVSSAEEFEELGLIEEGKMPEFEKAFGDPLKMMCVFWVHGEMARYISYPFAKRDTDPN